MSDLPEREVAIVAPTEKTRELESRQQPQDMLQVVMRAAMDPSVDPARLEQFLKIGRELEADKAKREWAMAFRGAKDEIDSISITKRGKIIYPAKKPGDQETVIKFARYEDLAEVVKPILRKHQLTASYTYEVEQTPPKTVCVMTLLHASGHAEKFRSVPLPMVDSGGGKNDVQGAGSVMTYGRRYAVQAAFDIVAEGEDDDGNLGRDQPKPITDAEFETIDNILNACEDKEPGARKRFMSWFQKQFKSSEDLRSLLQGSQFKAVMTALTQKQKALGLLK